MSSPRDPARLRQGLNPLTTSLGGFGGQHQTPMSAMSMSSSHLQSAQTPGSAIQPYNPQEWVASPAPVPERQVQYSHQPQVSPLPPPPYSPPRSQQPRPLSSVFDHAPASTPPPVPRLSSMSLHRPSPEPQVNPSFPPPPGSGGRGPSRERRFGLPSMSLGRRQRERDHGNTTPEPPPLPLSYSTRPSMSTVQIHMPEALNPLSTLSIGPPAARRTMSAGAVETPTSARSRSGSQTRWDSGLPVPPPPPGPPPSSSRSQSVQPMDRSNVPILSPPTRRPPSNGATALGPVPPTPAGWVDDSNPQQEQGAQPRAPALTIDTTTPEALPQNVDSTLSSSSAGGLNRAGAVRHDKTILQRRTESRSRMEIRGSIDERTHSMADIVVPESSSRGASRTRYTPNSGGQPRTGESSAMGDSRNPTPRIGSAKVLHTLDTGMSPLSHPTRSAQQVNSSPSIAPKSLPTPPPHARSSSKSKARETSRPPLSASSTVSKYAVVTQSAEQFATGAVERFQAFAATEATANSDADRVRLFADFIVSESRVRRERYSSAIGAMGSEIFDLTRDLFRPMIAARRESNASQDEWTPESTEPTRSHRGSIGSARPDDSSSAPGSARLPPSPSGSNAQNNGNYTSGYMPSLSPILSMSVSDNYENGSSRGRPSSRWWENDSAQGDPSRKLERSKRESKYMGVPKEQWIEVELDPSHGASSDQPSSSDYPPEKTGWHDQPDESASTPQPSKFSDLAIGFSPSPAPRNPNYLDVSRLVTMPPPYPRHHPAVNNNHPELTSIRVSVRALSDVSEVSKVKEEKATTSLKRREDFAKAANERKQALRANLQREINSGNLGYADAGAIEQDAQEQEKTKKKELEKSEYGHFQNEVIMPLNELLTTRIAGATDLYDDLSRRLFDSSRLDADMPQEEGDDRPELLEKLTLLKWIFEAREALHKAIFDILSERNTRYADVVMTPYRLSGNTEKLKSAEVFFAEDAAKRQFAFANEVLDRARDFRAVMDEAVQRGVALQLSAFWDIAPPLCRLLEKIPSDLEGFNIQIMPSEFHENPSYHDHPMQYLFSLLLHTEKSTYQFIEAHTNLLCLLHEVKEAVVHAKGKVLAKQIAEVDGSPITLEEREKRANSIREQEGLRLTVDLKDQVRVVQDQWSSALGDCINSVKERSREWLLQTDGWDETLETEA